MKVRKIPWGRGAVIAPVVLVVLAGCASMQGPGAGAESPPADTSTATTIPVPEATVPMEEPTGPGVGHGSGDVGAGDVYATKVRAGLDPATLPAGFSLVASLDTPRDAQPAQLYGTSQYATARAEPSKDMGKVVTVRLVPTSPSARADAPAPADGVKVESRDDLAPGAVQYTLADTGDASVTIPAGDAYDVIVAANADSADMLVPFVEVITR